jgi:hypothetical protein
MSMCLTGASHAAFPLPLNQATDLAPPACHSSPDHSLVQDRADSEEFNAPAVCLLQLVIEYTATRYITVSKVVVATGTRVPGYPGSYPLPGYNFDTRVPGF